MGRIGRLLGRGARRRRSTAPITPRQPGSALKPFTYALAFEDGLTPASVLRRRAVALSDRRARRALQPAQLRRPLPRSAARAPRARRLGERAGGRAASELGVPALLRFLTRAGPLDLRQDAVVLRSRPDAWQRRGAARRARRRLRALRARRRVARSRRGRSPNGCAAPRGRERRSLVVAADRVLDHRRPVRRRARASTPSDAAAASSFRSRSRSRPERRRPTTTTGRSATRAT